MQGEIKIKLEGASWEETERCRAMIHLLFQQGVFNVRNGKVILNFDHNGLLSVIEKDVIAWRRDKESYPHLSKVLDNAIIEVISQKNSANSLPNK